MEQKAASIWKTSFMAGIYVGIVAILISVIFYVIGNPFAKPAQWLGYLVLVAGAVYGQINYKKALGGTMTYGQALGAGLLTILFASVISSIYSFVLYQFIDPSLQEQLRLFTEEQLIRQGSVPEEQMEMALNMSMRFQTPVMMLVMGTLGGGFIGLIISLITSIFTQKKPTDDFVE